MTDSAPVTTTRRSSVALFAGMLTVVAVLLVLLVIVAEGAVRLVVDPARWAFRDSTMDWQPDAVLGWVQKPNLDVRTRTEFDWEVHFRTNPDGITPPEARRERTPGTVRVMLFGDSTVVGRAVPQDLTVNRQLEKLLGTGGPVEVYNAGVQGYATDQTLLRMEQLIPLYKPDLVFYAACDNDFGGNSVSQLDGNPKPFFQVESDGSLKLTPPAVTAEIKTMDSGPRKWVQFSALYRYLQPTIVGIRARLGGWEQRNLLGLAPTVYWDPQEAARYDWALFEGLVARMHTVATEHGAVLYTYIHPAIAEVWEPYVRDTIKTANLDEKAYDRHVLERRLGEVTAKAGGTHCPLIDRFRPQQSRGPFHLLPRDPHCNAAGYLVTAEILKDCVAPAVEKARAR